MQPHLENAFRVDRNALIPRRIVAQAARCRVGLQIARYGIWPLVIWGNRAVLGALVLRVPLQAWVISILPLRAAWRLLVLRIAYKLCWSVLSISSGDPGLVPVRDSFVAVVDSEPE